MTVSAIGNIVFAIGLTEFIACIISRKVIFQSKSYTSLIEKFERAKYRRDKTAASLAIKQLNTKSQKSAEKEAKKLKHEQDEFGALAAEVARRHTMANFYPSLAFIILYKVLSAEYSGQIIALLPFRPFNFLQKMTFRGLSALSAKEVHALWVQSKGESDPTTILSGDVSSTTQACAFAFIYCLCSLSIKKMVNDMFGTKPPPGADDGIGTLMEAPRHQQVMRNFGVDPDELKVARKKGLGLL